MVAMDKKEILHILEEVTDPEIPVLTISDLGILQGVDIQENHVTVHIIPTYTGCPAMDMISVNIKAALQEAGVDNVSVELTLDPVWSTDMITAAGKEKMKKYGIAPPQGKAAENAGLHAKVTVPCPHCGARNTSLISHFGSTACKSLYRCEECKEPFDYFKCH